MNSLYFPEFPVRKLQLKAGAGVTLIRNLSFSIEIYGLQNLKLLKHTIAGEVMTVDPAGIPSIR